MGFSAVALPVKFVIPPCPYLGSEGGCLYDSSIRSSAAALPVNGKCCDPLPMFHPYLGNETGCPRKSSIRSSAATLPVNFVIPSPYSIHILETKLAKYMNPPFAPPQQPS
ncbi:hypothetical protein D9757_012069 [Collybiopsis confluens]|uniref:Uncharacterized protein n=1 Tax=Collybiopsis confluens TaxID=2823264 RepID=A0A8H5LLF5_9AGAR|nr:hypothetical protein D9757_012069 [Collybiopsis confluens]